MVEDQKEGLTDEEENLKSAHDIVASVLGSSIFLFVSVHHLENQEHHTCGTEH